MTDMTDPYKIVLKKQIEIEVEVEITLDKEQRDPSFFGMDIAEEDFTIEDTERWEELLEEEAEKIAKELAEQRLNEVVENAENQMKEGRVKSSELLKSEETCYVMKCTIDIETNDEDWKTI
ncbi:MAG: hypothetical protein WBV73_05730 [Phormidium sp.]